MKAFSTELVSLPTSIISPIITGAQTLITACPKRQVHFTCAQSDTHSMLEVIDLYTYLSQRLNE